MLQLSLLEWGTFLLLEGNYLEAAHECFRDAYTCARQSVHICVFVNVQTFHNRTQNSFDLQIDAFLWYTLYMFAFFLPYQFADLRWGRITRVGFFSFSLFSEVLTLYPLAW